MKKSYLLLILLLPVAFSTYAQFRVNSRGFVSIGGIPSDTLARLTIGSQPHLGNSTIGIAACPVAKEWKNNIGVEGIVRADNTYTNDTNYGVLGTVGLNYGHGRNYGVGGMISFTPSSYSYYGGAGIYGTNYSYMYSHPDNINGMYAAYFHGSTNLSGITTAQEIYVPADDRMTEGVEALGHDRLEEGQTLDNLLRLNVLEYNFKNRNDNRNGNATAGLSDEDKAAYEYMKADEEKVLSRRHFGISAQELQEVYPSLVLEGQDGYLAVNYTELVPLLIRSIQELKQELDEVKDTKEVARKTMETSTAATRKTTVGKSLLFQNTPNPFTAQTEMRFRLPEDASEAYIYIFDMTGKMLRQIPVAPSQQSVTINGYELSAGIYLYSLVVGGQEVDTKRMILSK